MTSYRRPPLIFVVDDDPTTNRMLSGILGRAGFQTASAFDAAGARRGISERCPDLVLLDINLPDGSGLEVCRWLQAERGAAQTPVLFISSNDDVAVKVQGFQAGGVDYIPKPIAAEEVLARVSTHLRLKQAYESLAELQAERIRRLAGAQQTLMPAPAELPEARFQVWLNQVLQAGGDFYDVIPVGSGVCDYLVADASGHDLAASFWTAALKTLIGEYTTMANSPLTIVRSLNGALNRILPIEVFFTLIYARLNRKTGILCVVNAGHPPAIVSSPAAAQVQILRQEGDVVGAFADAVFGKTEVKLKPGDRFFLLSDGLIEDGIDSAAALERVGAACRARQGLALEAVVQEVVAEATKGAQANDDTVFMGVEV
jgi:sigma-B regulation protein RsbU (phosphoserine phosphatase)